MPLLRLLLVFFRSRWALLFGWIASAVGRLAALRAGRWFFMAGVIGALAVFMPLPLWLEQLPTRLAGVPPGLVWFLGLIEFKFGLGVVMTAYVGRFAWRLMLEVVRS
jgi:hypothetical protein